MTDRPPHVVSLQMKTDGLAPSARFDNSEDSELSEGSELSEDSDNSELSDNPPKTSENSKSEKI